MSWKDLDIKLKAELIKLGVLSGIRDIKLIRLLYDDINTPTLVVDLSYNETNVKPLLGIEKIQLEYSIPEEEVNKANDIIQLIEKEISLEEINNQLPVLFRLFNKGGYISNNPTLALVGKVKKYDEGGLKDSSIILDYIFNGPLKRKKENSLEYRQALFNNVDPRNGYPSPWTAVKYYNTVINALNSGDTSKKWETDGSIGQETAAAGWAKFLDLPYNKEMFPVWNGDTVRLSPELEREIPIDTNLLKLDILEILYNRNLDRSMGIFDREEAYKTLLYTKQLALNNLRKTYKTGEWVLMNEFMGNSVNPFDWGKDYVSPLNVLLFYGLKYDKNTNSMLYGDLYNLNAFDYFLPGKPFIIRGSITLDQKKNGGKVKKYSKGGYENPDEPPVSESTYVELSPLNILELELLNYLLSKPTAEQEYFRNLAVLNMITPQSNLGVILTKEEQDLVDKAFLGYNNFRYSHPWMEGLNYTPIIGDGMDLISLAGDVNNKDYMSAGLGLGMLALPNFILKPLLKYGKLLNIPDNVWDDLYNKAIKNNNLEKVLQLRDLHFKAKAPETRQRTPMFNASGESTFNEFNGGKTGLNWFSESEKYAANHGVPRAFYINEPNIYFGNVPAWVKGTPVDERYIESLRRLGYGEKQIAQKVQSINEAANSNAPAAKSIGMGANNELVTKSNNTAKLADAVTYDDNGKIIPLSKRDNFNNPDIRYSWLIPTIPFGLMSYKLFNQNNKEEYKNGGFLFPN